MNDENGKAGPRQVVVAGIFEDRERALHAVEGLIDEGFPMDRISLLGKGGGMGDDLLGITYHHAGERMKAWGAQGAFWGALWGLLAGTAGLFVVPGLGALMVAGPLVEAIAGAVAGAVVAGGAMAGAAALTELATVLHRAGIPEAWLEALEAAVDTGHVVVLLHGDPAEAGDNAARLQRWGPARVLCLPVVV
ncbi:MAG: hypothetical protein D6721_07055 [Gammaproteobacteria bacterium]|nr:MAG: hypothetical protein D6721_07055 [Gammaproteobacteria bacterium]